MLTVNNLNAYYGESHVLKDVSIAVKEGEVVVMLGPNGHGKSTLLKSICGLVDKKDGKITYQNRDINGLATEKLVDLGVIYISENRELFPYMTVLENLKLGAYTKNARPHEKENLERVFDSFSSVGGTPQTVRLNHERRRGPHAGCGQGVDVQRGFSVYR